MTERTPIESFPPGELIREELEERGWTPETARALGEAFGTSATIWMNLESAYRLSRGRSS